MYNYDYLKQKCHQRRLRIVLAMVGKYAPPDPSIVSIGCGHGIIEQNFPGIVHGVDRHVPDAPLISVVQGELESIPFENETYDLAFVGETLEHAYDTHKALSEVKRVLKRNGVLILTVPNVMSFRDRIRGVFGFLPRHLSGYLHDDPHLYEHIRHFNKKSLTELLQKHGFEVMEFSSPAININFLTSRPVDLYTAAQYVPSIGNNLICAARRVR